MIKRLAVAAFLLVLSCLGASAQSCWPDPNNTRANCGQPVMYVNGSGQAIGVSATNPLPIGVTSGGNTAGVVTAAVAGQPALVVALSSFSNAITAFTGQYNSSLPTLVNTQITYPQIDVNGRFIVVPAPNVDTAALITHTAASVGVNGADQTNASGRGINVVVNITAITGTTPTLTVTLQGKDQASGVYYNILTSAALAATGTTVLTVFPGAAVTANVSANAILPRTWRVISTIGGTTPAVTATVGASVIE